MGALLWSLHLTPQLLRQEGEKHENAPRISRRGAYLLRTSFRSRAGRGLSSIRCRLAGGSKRGGSGKAADGRDVALAHRFAGRVPIASGVTNLIGGSFSGSGWLASRPRFSGRCAIRRPDARGLALRSSNSGRGAIPPGY